MTDYTLILQALNSIDAAILKLYGLPGMHSVLSNLENVANLLQDQLHEMESLGSSNLEKI